jgi:large subunit ribosomal protein L30
MSTGAWQGRTLEARRASMARLKITQVRSGIGKKENQRRTLRSLGLKRVHDVVVKDDRPEIRGMVKTVTHLVTVEEVE